MVLVNHEMLQAGEEQEIGKILNVVLFSWVNFELIL